ncbi:hypothetical protein GIB67_027301, partial [Kingdonia uniflora]
ITRQLNNPLLKNNYKSLTTYRLDKHIPWLPFFQSISLQSILSSRNFSLQSLVEASNLESLKFFNPCFWFLDQC